MTKTERSTIERAIAWLTTIDADELPDASLLGPEIAAPLKSRAGIAKAELTELLETKQ